MLLQALPTPIPAGTIRDTLTVIVRERGYQQNVSATLLSRGWEWLSRVLNELFSNAVASPGTYLIVLGALGLLIGVAVARAIVVARARTLAAQRRAAEVTADELLTEARGLAAQGAYVDAAHRLYAAVVIRLVERRQVRKHPSKTVGDYGRELRASGDQLTPAYVAFARTYEVVAYGDGLCDATRYQRLERLAAPLFGTPTAQPGARAA